MTFHVDGIPRSSFWPSNKYNKKYYINNNNSNNNNNNINNDKYDVTCVSVVFSGMLMMTFMDKMTDMEEMMSVHNAYIKTFIDDDFILEYDDMDQIYKLQIDEITLVHNKYSDISSSDKGGEGGMISRINIDEYYKLNVNVDPFYTFLMNNNNNNNDNNKDDDDDDYDDIMMEGGREAYSSNGNRMKYHDDASIIARSMVIHNNRGILYGDQSSRGTAISHTTIHNHTDFKSYRALLFIMTLNYIALYYS